jgi:protein ImuB
VFAVLHIADFALHAVLRHESIAAGRPAALFSGTGKKSVVLATNPAARAAALAPGMTAPQAVARCPALLIRTPSAAAEAEARAALLAVGFTLSPAIEDTAPGVCTADLKGADPANFVFACRTAVTQLATLGLPATAGLARTPLLALYAARSTGGAGSPSQPEFQAAQQSTLPTDSPPENQAASEKQPHLAESPAPYLSAPIAAASAQPNLSLSSFSLSFFSPTPAPPLLPSPKQRKTKEKEERERAHSAPPPAAPLPRARDRNRALDRPSLAPDTNPIVSPHSITSATTITSTNGTDGVRLVSPAAEKSFLAPLPLAAADPSTELAAVLANWGLRTLGDLTALPRDEIVRRFGAEGLALWQRAAGGDTRPLHPVVPPQKFSAQIEFENEIETLEPLLFILRRFLDRLALELRASQHVAAELHLTLKLEDDTAHTRRFRLPEPTADVEILFRALHTHLEALTTPAAIVALSLDLTPARPLVRQQGLFETGLRDPHGFAETLARVSALVGAERVGTPQLEDTHRPDAFKLAAPAPVIASPAADPIHPSVGLPLRRFRPPLPVRLSRAADGTVYLWSDRVQGEISLRSAPYPASGEWWQPDRAWQRTEWDIALAEGGLYRLVQIGREHFLEGEYD